jgi:serine phosphatase RsbU (regulator of sigma subunit)
MEIFGSNRGVRRTLELAGLRGWIDAQPLGGAGGGDIHFLSSCGSGNVSRVFMADVAGHGSEVDSVARRLRNLMRKFINTYDQTQFARALNDAMVADTKADRFATALLATYFSPTHHFIVCNAGHPKPLWYSTRNGGWRWLDEQTRDAGDALSESKATYHFQEISNIPLGILEPTDYAQFAVQLAPGDLVVLYTDGITETTNQNDEIFGEARLLAAVEQLGQRTASELGEALLEVIRDFRGEQAPQDDCTLLVLEHTATHPPLLNPLRTVKNLLKLLGVWSY